MVEVCWFLRGKRFRDSFVAIKNFYGRGTEASVAFKWEPAMHPLVLGWLHTHPHGFGVQPSELDERTMRSWVRSKGQAMICGIQCDEEVNWFDYFRASNGKIYRMPLEVRSFCGVIRGHRTGIPEAV